MTVSMRWSTQTVSVLELEKIAQARMHSTETVKKTYSLTRLISPMLAAPAAGKRVKSRFDGVRGL